MTLATVCRAIKVGTRVYGTPRGGRLVSLIVLRRLGRGVGSVFFFLFFLCRFFFLQMLHRVYVYWTRDANTHAN